MSPETIRNFIEKYTAGSYSEEEHEQFMDWVKTTPVEEVVKLVAHYQETAPLTEKATSHPELMSRLETALTQYDKIVSLTPGHIVETGSGKVSRMWTRWAVAASVLLAVGITSYFFLFNKKDRPAAVVQTAIPNDVKAPKSNKATIRLADGNIVYLDSVRNGQLAMQGHVRLVKRSNGQIAYQTERGEVIREIQYNTLSNPRGSKVIDMQLADGSHVWLNAGSSVTYPIAFMGTERKVVITGEAYFEVAHDASRPFYVTKGGMTVQVLGTHFNVNAYDDESDIKVTLLEGSVRLTRNAERLTLKPGQQAIASTHSPLTIDHSPDTEQVMAWKNGFFNFEGADLQTAMRQLERWYDITVIYEKGGAPIRFGGEMSRDVSLSEVLDILKDANVHFRMEEGRKLVVIP